jgi:transposase
LDKQTGELLPIFDYRQERIWRHLDSMEHATFIHCRLPRVRTSDGKIHTVEVDWADAGISHTKKFENLCISTLQATHCQKTASELMDISDDKMCGIMHRSVARGLEKRDLSTVRKISLDEKSYGKGHQYISVLSNSCNGTILDVEKDRTEQAASNLLKKTLNPDRLSCISSTCCDMWDAFINALKKTVQTPSWFTISFTLSNT